MLEDDYRFIRRIEEYAQRRWKEPLVCSYLWDKYGLETKLVNRKDKLCRIDVDYAYDDDFNLRIILSVNTKSPFVNQYLECNAIAYNDKGEVESGYLVLYMNSDIMTSNTYDLVGELPLSYRIRFAKNFNIVAKFYTRDETDYDETIIPEEDVNTSDIITIQAQNYEESNYFVSKDGDDSNSGTMEEPFRTLQHAADVINIGDTICCLTDLTLTDSVFFYTSCNLIGEDINTKISSENEQYITLYNEAYIYLQNIIFDNFFDFNNGGYIYNDNSAMVSVESFTPKTNVTYDLDIVSDSDYWFSGDEVTLTLIDSKDALIGKTAYIFNTLNNLITTISLTGGKNYNFKYTIPLGISTDRITAVVPHYYFAKDFAVETVDSDWYVNTNTGSDSNTGLMWTDPFKTVKCAVEHATTFKNRIYLVGTDTVNDINLDKSIVLYCATGKSKITSSDSYFTVQSTCTLTIRDLMMDDNFVDEMTVTNNGTAKVKVMVV